MQPKYCEQCRVKRIVAVIGGPTCQCTRPKGADWWPADWQSMSEGQRLEFIKDKAAKLK